MHTSKYIVQETDNLKLHLIRHMLFLEYQEEIVEAELEDEVTEQAMTNEQFQNVCAAMNL